MLLTCPGGFSGSAGGAADVGGIGWRLGVQPGAARWNGRQGGRGVLARRRSAHAHVLVHVLLERAGTQTPTTTTASTQAAALCSDLWSIPVPWQARAGRSTERERGDDAPSGGGGRRGPVDQEGTSTAFSAGDLHSGLGTSLAGDPSRHPTSSTSEAALAARTRLPVLPAPILALAWWRRSSAARIAHPGHRTVG